MRVLVTGTEGYIGSLLRLYLERRGHSVCGLDTGYYRDALLEANGEPKTDRWGDLRSLGAGDVDGIDGIVHLAELSNDATGQLVPGITRAINHLGSVKLAALAREAGVRRFVYFSSCSVYGRSGGAEVTEDSPVDPRTEYAICKALVERDLAEMAGAGFTPVFLRHATAYGASPRMRFDLVVNNLAGLAWTERRIAMLSDGTPWRPLVHVEDICRAAACALEAPAGAVHKQVFNVGRTRENYQVREIAGCVAKEFPGCELTFGRSDPDQRSYRVSFEKIHGGLPGFACEWDLERGVRQLRELFERVNLTRETFRFRAFTRLAQIRHLRETGQIDEEFYWTRA